MHLMIDLETLGLNPNCVVTQIGYCVFAMQETDVQYSQIIRPDPNEQMTARRRSVDWSTIKWWFAQSNEARESLIKDADGTMHDCLVRFFEDINTHYGWDNIEGVWANGISFDIAIMEDLFYQYEFKMPWKYNKPRDTRTIWSIVPEGMIAYHKPVVAHDAREDAICQAKNIQLAYKCLTQHLQADQSNKVAG